MTRRVAAALLWLGSVSAAAPALAQVVTDPAALPAGAYRLETAHSQLLFSIAHLGLTDYYGRFDRLSGTLHFDPHHPERSTVAVSVDPASVDTPSADLNSELSGPDVFDTQKFPEATFRSTTVTTTGPSTGQMVGDLTLRGVTRKVTLLVSFSGGAPDPLSGGTAVGFRATGKIKRSDFGITGMRWEPLVGDDVTLIINAMFDSEEN
ncbi:MAG TPA: YceI family protein [Rhizomicrobium sp.]|nr:YceI family protein [Rhizomicrobium sp.]